MLLSDLLYASNLDLLVFVPVSVIVVLSVLVDEHGAAERRALGTPELRHNGHVDAHVLHLRPLIFRVVQLDVVLEPLGRRQRVDVLVSLLDFEGVKAPQASDASDGQLVQPLERALKVL